MILPIDCDLFGMFWTTAVVVFGSKSQLRKNSLPIPVHYQRQVVEETSLSEQQRKHLASLDAQLAPMNYRPMCTFRVTNYGVNLLREYSNLADPAHCTVTIVEVHTNVHGLKTSKNSHVVNFTTRFFERQMAHHSQHGTEVRDEQSRLSCPRRVPPCD